MSAAKQYIKAKVIAEDGTAFIILPIGRDAWALERLITAGGKGITPIDTPAPRWSAYIHKLRTEHGMNIATIHEPHGGQFPGHHARYVLNDNVQIVSRGWI